MTKNRASDEGVCISTYLNAFQTHLKRWFNETKTAQIDEWFSGLDWHHGHTPVAVADRLTCPTARPIVHTVTALAFTVSVWQLCLWAVRECERPFWLLGRQEDCAADYVNMQPDTQHIWHGWPPLNPLCSQGRSRYIQYPQQQKPLTKTTIQTLLSAWTLPLTDHPKGWISWKWITFDISF